MFRLVSKIYFSGEISLNNKDNNFKVFVFKNVKKVLMKVRFNYTGTVCVMHFVFLKGGGY